MTSNPLCRKLKSRKGSKKDTVVMLVVYFPGKSRLRAISTHEVSAPTCWRRKLFSIVLWNLTLPPSSVWQKDFCST